MDWGKILGKRALLAKLQDATPMTRATPMLALLLVQLMVSCAAHESDTLKASYSTVVDTHISSLMTLYLAPELTQEWSSRLDSQQTISTREYGDIVLQSYSLPW